VPAGLANSLFTEFLPGEAFSQSFLKICFRILPFRILDTFPAEGRSRAMTEPGTQAQVRLRRVVELLKEARTEMEEIAAGLPAPENEAMLLGDEEPDVATEVRSTIECSLADQIGPAIRDLASAAVYRPKIPNK
jgi:hypothetical protein